MNGRLSLGALMATGAYVFLHPRTSIEKDDSIQNSLGFWVAFSSCFLKLFDL